MTRLPLVSSEHVIKKLRKIGFEDAPYQGKGSHRALYKIERGRKFLVIVPKRDPLPRGTLISIMKQAGLSREEFIELLSE
jgi:predicted RNA binding protein YcfA (HicA-like mRNA interferase family)